MRESLSVPATSYESRIAVKPECVSWDIDCPDYQPPEYTADIVLTRGVEEGWADTLPPSAIDFTTRVSFAGDIIVDERGRPRYPLGRTGLAGRGELGKWGPNHAADPIVFARNESGGLSLLLIEREDDRGIGLPGGMVDAGERFSDTAIREAREETEVDLHTLEFTLIYRGIVLDPRNTDNAWMETQAGYVVLDEVVRATAGSDAKRVMWEPVEGVLNMKLFASHSDVIKKALADIESKGLA